MPSRDPVVCTPRSGTLPEGLRWDDQRQEVIWVDIVRGELYRSAIDGHGLLTPECVIALDVPLGSAASAENGGYVLAAGAGFAYLDESGSLHDLAQPERAALGVRMNDGACDGLGRFWAGSMAEDERPGFGSLFCLDLDGTCTRRVEGMTISNGIGWSLADDVMYLVDSGEGVIYAFDFDLELGRIGKRRQLVSFPGRARPDGLMVDNEDGIWVALWGGSGVCRFTPDGKLSDRIEIPVPLVTSSVFAGREGDVFIVSTANLDSEVEIADAGHLFNVGDIGHRGRPSPQYRGTA